MLKASAEELFQPQLPASKLNSIEVSLITVKSSDFHLLLFSFGLSPCDIEQVALASGKNMVIFVNLYTEVGHFCQSDKSFKIQKD